MTVEVGRRRVVISFRVEPVKRSTVAPADAQVARAAKRTAEMERRRWDSEVALMGRGPIA
ncbi:MAG: hypothetical protein H0W06_02405 [Chloroflexia bacterium]|nr:hypothetical protein [Chloroflexia bacterium]